MPYYFRPDLERLFQDLDKNQEDVEEISKKIEDLYKKNREAEARFEETNRLVFTAAKEYNEDVNEAKRLEEEEKMVSPKNYECEKSIYQKAVYFGNFGFKKFKIRESFGRIFRKNCFF